MGVMDMPTPAEVQIRLIWWWDIEVFHKWLDEATEFWVLEITSRFTMKRRVFNAKRRRNGESAKLILQIYYINSLVQDCSNSIANAMELLQSCTKLSIYPMKYAYNSVVSCFGVVMLWFLVDHVTYFLISFRVISLALGNHAIAQCE